MADHPTKAGRDSIPLGRGKLSKEGRRRRVLAMKRRWGAAKKTRDC